jgi:hypothetical protein
MAYKQMLIALGLIAASSPASASTREPPPPGPAPTDSADTRYCLRIEAIIGSRIEEVRCWTRGEWAEQEVDVDQEWDKEGVAVIR